MFNDSVPSSQMDKELKYWYGAIINLLYLQEANSPCLDASIQKLINEMFGVNHLLGYPAELLSICGCLETARMNKDQFRKCVLDAANLIDKIGGHKNV